MNWYSDDVFRIKNKEAFYAKMKITIAQAIKHRIFEEPDMSCGPIDTNFNKECPKDFNNRHNIECNAFGYPRKKIYPKWYEVEILPIENGKVQFLYGRKQWVIDCTTLAVARMQKFNRIFSVEDAKIIKNES